MLIEVLLASTLLQSIPAAIARTEEEQLIDVEHLTRRMDELEARVVRDEQIAVETWRCFNRALIGAGMDLGSTAAGIKYGKAAEANPLGFNVESRVALKFSQLGVTGTACYLANKGGRMKLAKVASWVSFGIQVVFTVNNTYLAIKGKQ